MKKNTAPETKTMVRPPIVVIMGHIDHGKTTILDWYRKTKVVDKESGGITQHIGAYEVMHHGKKITFIDTPGHEAFSKIRSRGAKIADIAILVVAAEEGVKPQTREAIQIIQQNNLPFVVALNKMDKPEANPERVKQELAKEEVLIESYGGKVPLVEISAKQGTRMDDLLEMLLLLAEIEHLDADPQKPAEGVVIEAHRDARRGVSTTLLVRNGTLKKQDFLVIGRILEPIKMLADFLGTDASEIGPSSPALLAGLNEVPMVGDLFYAFSTRSAAEEFMRSLPAEVPRETAKTSLPVKSEKPIFNVILKADVVGSKEALEDALQKLDSETVGIRVLKTEVGDIGEFDVKFALATERVTIIGFKVKVDSSTKELAKNNNIRIVTGEVIYDILDAIKKEMNELVPPEIKRTELGRAKILKIFKKDGARQIVGGRVEEGILQKGAKAEIKRAREVIGSGTIAQLQSQKRDVESVERGLEFGILIESKTALQEGDIVEIFKEEIIKQTLF